MNLHVFDLMKVAEGRFDQPSYHLASEDSFRIQVFNLSVGDVLGEWSYAGNVLALIILGHATITIDGTAITMGPLCEAVIPRNHRFKISPLSEKVAVQIVWSPPFLEVITHVVNP